MLKWRWSRPVIFTEDPTTDMSRRYPVLQSSYSISVSACLATDFSSEIGRIKNSLNPGVPFRVPNFASLFRRYGRNFLNQTLYEKQLLKPLPGRHPFSLAIFDNITEPFVMIGPSW